MGGDKDGEWSDGFWDSDDDEIKNLPPSSDLNSRFSNGMPFSGPGEASSSAGPSHSSIVWEFVGMGFSKDNVIKAIEQNGEGNSDAILETLLTYSALDEPAKHHSFSDLSSESAGEFLDELSDVDSDLGNENGTFYQENTDTLSEKENKIKLLVDMGYHPADASIAVERCGPDASVVELTDFICAAQLSKEADAYDAYEEKLSPPSSSEDEMPSRKHSAMPLNKKRRLFKEEERKERKKEKRFEMKFPNEDDDALHLPNPMVGFGLPSDTWTMVQRKLPEAAIGPPYFYYENVALAPKGVWKKMSSFLYEIEPEFVDSQFFSAAARKRGYIHNLPINNRKPLLPIPAQTIHEAFPLTKKWWPWWDRRTKLNCLQTCTASAKLTERIRKALEDCADEPPVKVQKYIINECKKWNLVWVGRNKVAPLEPDEIETLLGFPKNHTRGGGISRTERLRGLGNSFQVDTVAFHLSVLRDMFPNGINVLSLFSGIGGAEVALHRLGIPLKNVVAVEINESSRNILRSWWESTSQKGMLHDVHDVCLLDASMLEKFIHSIGGFDLIIGGSPCNNISGSNRVSRSGLEGKDSSLFFHFFRILNEVKILMGRP